MNSSYLFIFLCCTANVASLKFSNEHLGKVSEKKERQRITDFSRGTRNYQKITTLGCKLICHNVPQQGMDVWFCNWMATKSKCQIVTREIMRSAETTSPSSPYLVNVTSSKCIIGIGSGNGVSAFEDGFLSDYPRLFGFVSNYNPIRELYDNMFEGVDGLKYVEICDCPYLVKVNRAFHKLKSLEFLLFYNNTLENIKVTNFRNLFSLTELALQNNGIRYIEDHAFVHLFTLRALMLEGNRITSLHPATFTNLTSLDYLNLGDNSIKFLSKETFKNMPNLNHILLYQNPLVAVPSRLFDFSNMLLTITVGCCRDFGLDCRNASMSLQRQSFLTRGLYLSRIVIDGCLTDMEPSAFEGINTRQLAIIGNDGLKGINKTMFIGIKAVLEELLFGGNGIETIEFDSFYDPQLSDLSSLHLQGNKIGFIQPHTFKKLIKLKHLYLFVNHISVIDTNSFKGLGLLTDLYLDYNNISKICKNAFSDLKSLRNLTLSYNQLFNLTEVSFHGLTRLNYLDLSYNHLKAISSEDFEVFSITGSINTILLQGNMISTIESATFDYSWKLDLLDLSNNALSVIDGIFRGRYSPIIEKLVMSKNVIRKINFNELAQVGPKELLLDQNLIRDLNFLMNMDVLPELLNISINQINAISEVQMKSLKKIHQLDITNNPWICNCEVSSRYLMHFLLERGIVSCCPSNCHCIANKDQSAIVDCSSQNKSSLQPCFPYNQVKLYYANNLLEKVNLENYQENITFLDLHQNCITNVNGSSLKLLKNLTHLDLRSNFLETLPLELGQLNAAKVYLKGNRFLCSDCSLINILKSVTSVTPQDISCKNNQTFNRASYLCFVVYTIIPYGSIVISIMILIAGVYNLVKILYMKKLGERYVHISVLLSSKEASKAYKEECAILKDIEHINVRKMIKGFKTWTPFFKRIGHYYFERIECSLSEAMEDSSILNVSLILTDLTRQLIDAIQYLHSREKPLLHGNLNTNTVFLQQDRLTKVLILKIGGFSRANVVKSTNCINKGRANVVIPTSDGTPSRGSSGQINSSMNGDLKAAAKIIFFLFTHKETSEMVKMEELTKLPNIEISTLILSLQQGMTAAKALETAAFHSEEQKVLLITELNGLLIVKRKHKKSHEIFSTAEDNSCLVIGGSGGWNKLLEFIVMEEFALFHNGYDITSFVDLLRIIRNIFQHGHENPKSMVAAFGTVTPNYEQMVREFSSRFPIFYLHCLLTFYHATLSKEDFESNVFLMVFKQFESFLCRRGLASGSILPLQEKSFIHIRYKSVSVNITEVCTFENTRSVVEGHSIFQQIFSKCQQLWPDFPKENLLVKHHSNVNLNPLAHSTTPQTETTKIRFPEGSIIQVLKPELRIQLPQCDRFQPTSSVKIMMGFKLTDNVKAIKGLVMKNLSHACRKKVNPESIKVTFNDAPLRDNQKLFELDFTNFDFIIRFPEIQETESSVELSS